MSEPVKIVVMISGGMVSAVASLGVPVSVLVVDFDAQDVDEDDDTVVLIAESDARAPALAAVEDFSATTLDAAQIAALEPFWGD